MQAWVKKSWPVVKLVLTAVILVAVGRQFLRDLAACPDLGQRPFRPVWLVLAGLLYLCGLGCSALFWHRLLVSLGQTPLPWNSARAYYVGHLGKYVPGKAWALLLRALLARAPGVHLGVAASTSLYEVLTTMTGGMVLAVILFACLVPDRSAQVDWQVLGRLLLLQEADETALDRKVLVALSLLVLAVVGWPILPTIFNRVVARMALPFQDGRLTTQRLSLATLVEGLLLAACGWMLLGASLGCVLRAVGTDAPWSLALWGRQIAYLALAYVVGFVVLIAPSGLGVREYFLKLFLVPELLTLGETAEAEARATAVVVVVVTRLVWTAAELLACAVLWPRWFAPTNNAEPR
jgi:uncharacterized membrane protein YbhN (UPF0104 family)